MNETFPRITTFTLIQLQYFSKKHTNDFTNTDIYRSCEVCWAENVTLKRTWAVGPLRSDRAWIVSGSYQPGKVEVGGGGGNWGCQRRKPGNILTLQSWMGKTLKCPLSDTNARRGEERRDSSVISIMQSGLYGSST